MFNVYPDTLRAILAYLEALDAAEEKLKDVADCPYPKAVQMVDNDGTDYGTLRDEIGGAWSWFPPTKDIDAG